MRGIRGNLWLTEGADEAVEVWTSLFENSSVGDRLTYSEAGQDIHGREPGSTMTIEFSLAGCELVALEGGPAFQLNPSISLAVSCPSAAEVDRLWAELSKDGKVLMELGAYDWAPRYGFVQDRFGLSWQLSYPGEDAPVEKSCAPNLIFTGEAYRRAQEAMEFYTATFEDSRIDQVVPNEEGEGAGSVMWAEFTLAGQRFTAMESSLDHGFTFNEGFSLLVACENQAEIDRYWEALGSGGTLGPCGWLTDRFGVSWQVAPIALQQMLRDGDAEQARRVTDCFMKMQKLELAEIEAAFQGTQ